MLQAFVGAVWTSEQFHVFELTRQLPCFSMYSLAATPTAVSVPSSFVTFRLNERVQRVSIYLEVWLITFQTYTEIRT